GLSGSQLNIPFNFPIGVDTGVDAIPLPVWAAPWQVMEDRAEDLNLVFAQNTLEIVLQGTHFRRVYVERFGTDVSNATPTNAAWLATTTGVTDYWTNRAAAPAATP